MEALRLQTVQDQQEISQLRAAYEKISTTLADQSKLLPVMESDKVALSRAMTQNKDMKDRLEVLMAELEQSRQDRVLRDQRIIALETDLKTAHTASLHHQSALMPLPQTFTAAEMQTEAVRRYLKNISEPEFPDQTRKFSFGFRLFI
jgi:hypothetical protein